MLRLLFVALIGFAFVSGWAGGWTANGAMQRRLKAADADNLRQLDSGGARPPLWARLPTCRKASAEEVLQDRAALDVLRAFRANEIGQLGFAAVKHFSNPEFRRRERPDPLDPAPCLEPDMISPVADAAIAGGAFKSKTLFEPGIGLAEQIGPTHPEVVQAIARTAFAPDLIPADYFRTDLRPYARLVLAEFGPQARPFGPQALSQISPDDSMGTGAAQIAVAAGQPGALARVEKLMTELLRRTPENKPIPRLTRNRLYELAYALAMGGADAKPYAAPLVQLLDRKVESFAPPFGMVALPPARMCPVAAHIGGAVAAAAARHEFCRGDFKTLEQ